MATLRRGHARLLCDKSQRQRGPFSFASRFSLAAVRAKAGERVLELLLVCVLALPTSSVCVHCRIVRISSATATSHFTGQGHRQLDLGAYCCSDIKSSKRSGSITL
jgi:hypothetical protein